MVDLGYSDFCRLNNTATSGNSYSILSEQQLIEVVKENWDKREKGMGESSLDRKVVVPVPTHFDQGRFGVRANKPLFHCTTALIEDSLNGLALKSYLTRRKGQHKEHLHKESYLPLSTAEAWGITAEPALSARIVCYHKDALLENNGKRSSDSEWEIVTILASAEPNEPMNVGTMIRNELEQDGGTKSVYSKEDYLRSLDYWGRRIKLRDVVGLDSRVVIMYDATPEHVGHKGRVIAEGRNLFVVMLDNDEIVLSNPHNVRKAETNG